MTDNPLREIAQRLAGHIRQPMEAHEIARELEGVEYGAELMMQHLLLLIDRAERSEILCPTGDAHGSLSSDTPETAALRAKLFPNTWEESYWAMKNHAEKLERERDEARKELRHLADLLDAHFERGGTVGGIGTTNKARQILSQDNAGGVAR